MLIVNIPLNASVHFIFQLITALINVFIVVYGEGELNSLIKGKNQTGIVHWPHNTNTNRTVQMTTFIIFLLFYSALISKVTLNYGSASRSQTEYVCVWMTCRWWVWQSRMLGTGWGGGRWSAVLTPKRSSLRNMVNTYLTCSYRLWKLLKHQCVQSCRVLKMKHKLPSSNSYYIYNVNMCISLQMI